jgi:hypothetical protein
LRHQPSRGVITRGGPELAARRQLTTPPSEQLSHLLSRGWDPQPGHPLATGPVHLIDRALHHTASQVVDLNLVPQLHKLEVGLHRLRTRQPRARRRRAQHLAEVGISIPRRHVPQRPTKPAPHLLEMAHITADRAIRQPRGRPGKHEPRDHVSLKPLDLLRTSRGTHLAQIPHDRQPHRDTPNFTPTTKTST